MYKNKRFETLSHSQREEEIEKGHEHSFQTQTVKRIVKERGLRFLRSDRDDIIINIIIILNINKKNKINKIENLTKIVQINIKICLKNVFFIS